MPNPSTGHDDRTGVHAWTELLTRVRFGTQKALGKSVSGARVHAVAERLARYATHKTGADIRPGLARVAVDMEMDYRTVRAAVAILVRTGLLKLVVKSTRPGDPDEYQLTIPVDLLDREDLEVWSPGRHRLELERVRESVRGKYRRPDLQGPQGPQIDEPAGATGTADPVDNPVDAGATGTADRPSEPISAGATGTADSKPAGATRANLRSQRPQLPISDHVVKETTQPEMSLEPELAGSRVRADGDSNSDEVPEPPPEPPPPILRLVGGTEVSSPPVVTEPKGYGFCVPCHRAGKNVLAADPVDGSKCPYHLRQESA